VGYLHIAHSFHPNQSTWVCHQEYLWLSKGRTCDIFSSLVSIDPLTETFNSRWLKLVAILRVVLEVQQCRKQQNHIPSLVHDWRMAVSTSDLTRQLVLGSLLMTIVPSQAMMTFDEVDVFLVENSCPLERCTYKNVESVLASSTNGQFLRATDTMKDLTGGAVTVFRCQRPLATQLILDFAAVAASRVSSLEFVCRLVYCIRSSSLPFFTSSHVGFDGERSSCIGWRSTGQKS
jgi:hypothetical protein